MLSDPHTILYLFFLVLIRILQPLHLRLRFAPQLFKCDLLYQRSPSSTS